MLTLAAVNQDQVRRHRIARRHFLVAPRQGLAHRRIVVARLDALDVETPVVALLHRTIDADHARGDGAFAHGVADVEAFDAARRLWHFKCLLQTTPCARCCASSPASAPAAARRALVKAISIQARSISFFGGPALTPSGRSSTGYSLRIRRAGAG
jgi:hypothetical protein